MNYLALRLDLESLYHQDILIYLKSQEALEILPAQECQRVLELLKGKEEIVSTARKMHNCNYKDSLQTKYKDWDFQNGNFDFCYIFSDDVVEVFLKRTKY